MKIKKKIIVLLIIALSLSVLLPFLFRNNEESLNQTINVIGTLVASIASLITLLIAILLFNKFGIEAPLLAKNTEVVFAFLEEFKKTRFQIKGKDYGLFIKLHDSLHTHFEDWYAEKLLFPTDYLLGIDKLMKISESPFMPKSIYDKIEKLRFNALIMDIKDDDVDQYAIVTVVGQRVGELKLGRFNQKDMTLFEFLNIIDELKLEIQKWFNENSNYSPNLNI